MIYHYWKQTRNRPQTGSMHFIDDERAIRAMRGMFSDLVCIFIKGKRGRIVWANHIIPTAKDYLK